MHSVDKLRAYEDVDRFENMEPWDVAHIADEIEAEIAERYMLLPCDYDGEPLRIGDITTEGKVARMMVRDDGESSVYVYKLPNVLHEFACYEVGHVKPRTLEDVLADFAADVENDRNNIETARKYAAEIRELIGGDAE